MQNQSPASQMIETLVQFRKWWLLPTLVCTVLAIGFALFSQKTYSSRQTLVVRDDLVGTFYKPGRFDSLDSMKSAQETILELSRRPSVVRSALQKLDPPALTSQKHWLSDQVVEETQGKIQIGAPNGAEFGRTEAIVLTVKEGSRERSKKFIACLLDEIENSLKALRSQQFASMQDELGQTVTLAEEAYNRSADQLRKFEQNVGADLSTLISLNDSQAGTNNLQSELANLSIEQRNAWENLEDVKKQIQILQDVAKSPEALLEVPQELLQLQPTLASLAKGLNDAVLKYSATKGKYEPSHPNAGQDFRAIQDIKLRIKDKLVRTLSSLKYQLELRQGKHDRISGLINEKKIRLRELSSMRVDYATLREDVAKKREINGKAKANLAEIQTLGGAAKEINLLARVDESQTDIYPDGPSNKIIVFGGMAAGLFIGLGMVMFIAPLDESIVAAASRPANGHGSIWNGFGDRRRNPNSNPTSNVNPVSTPAPSPTAVPTDQSKAEVNKKSTTQSASKAPFQSQPAKPTRQPKPLETTQGDPNSLDTDYTFKPSVEKTADPRPIATSATKSISAQIAGTQISSPIAGSIKSASETDPIPQTNAAETSKLGMATEVDIQVPNLQQQTKLKTSADKKSDKTAKPGDENESTASEIEAVLSKIRSKHLGAARQSEQPTQENAQPKTENSKPDVSAPAYTRGASGDQDVVDTTSDSFDSVSSYIQQTKTDADDSDLEDSKSLDSGKFDLNLKKSDPAALQPVTAIEVPFVEPLTSDPETGKSQITPDDSIGKTNKSMGSTSKSVTQAATAAALGSIATPDETETKPNWSDQPKNDASPKNDTAIDDSFADSTDSTDIHATEIEPPSIDFSSLRIRGDESTSTSEKISQLDQNEIQNTIDGATKIQPISDNTAATKAEQLNEPPFDKQEIPAGLPFDTSIQNSSENIGDESDPNTGVKPENRPTATTVDLRMLKDQLSGKMKKAPPKPTLSDVLSKSEAEEPTDDDKIEMVDQSISDLANSIRNMCQQKTGNDTE